MGIEDGMELPESRDFVISSPYNRNQTVVFFFFFRVFWHTMKWCVTATN